MAVHATHTALVTYATVTLIFTAEIVNYRVNNIFIDQ